MPTYIIRAGLTGPVKIGKADDVEKRREALQTAHHETLHVLRVIDTPFDAEPIMHKRFAALRLRGEWFEFDPEMLTFIPEGPSAPVAEPAGRTWADVLAPWSAKELARRLGSNQKTVENWKTGKTEGPNVRFIFLMFQDPDLWKLPLLVAGRDDLINPDETIDELLKRLAEAKPTREPTDRGR